MFPKVSTESNEVLKNYQLTKASTMQTKNTGLHSSKQNERRSVDEQTLFLVRRLGLRETTAIKLSSGAPFWTKWTEKWRFFISGHYQNGGLRLSMYFLTATSIRARGYPGNQVQHGQAFTQVAFTGSNHDSLRIHKPQCLYLLALFVFT